MPAASGASTIAGKIVTMSKVMVLTWRSPVQVEQSCRRLDHNPPRADVNRRADLRSKRNEYLTVLAFHDEPAAPQGAFDALHDSYQAAVSRFHPTPHEVVVVERSCRQGDQLPCRDPQLETGQRGGIRYPVNACHPYYRAIILEPDAGERQLLYRSPPPHEQLGARPEALAWKIGLQIHDELSPQAVRAGN